MQEANLLANVQPGTYGAFEAWHTEGALTLANLTAQEFRYFAEPAPDGEVVVVSAAFDLMPVSSQSVQAVPQPAPPPMGAGLVYGLDPDVGTYFAVTLQDDATLVLSRGDAAGMVEIQRYDVSGYVNTTGLTDLLTIVGEGDTIDVLLNGTPMFTYSDPTLDPTGHAGVFAHGQGTFTFWLYDAQPFARSTEAGTEPVQPEEASPSGHVLDGGYLLE
ncbi:MAG: hypothetical protein ACK4YP_10290 [Myxococcota bacterium]